MPVPSDDEGRKAFRFSYQTTDAMIAIRENFEGVELTLLLAVYITITEFAGQLPPSGIAKCSGISESLFAWSCARLAELDLLEILAGGETSLVR